jgi:phosphoribosyl 1,2-cyclic phosphate phosphodiesterase
LEIVVMGSGAANRLPYIGCHCPRCEAARQDPRERRTTTGLWLRSGVLSVLLDAGPDLYAQAIREGMDRLDAILITHNHRDHMLGLECLETLVRYGQAGQRVAVYGPADLIAAIGRQFDYLLRLNVMELYPIAAGERVTVGNLTALPFAVRHHHATTFGYRVEWQGQAERESLPTAGSTLPLQRGRETPVPGSLHAHFPAPPQGEGQGEGGSLQGDNIRSLIYLPDFETLSDGRPLGETEIPPFLQQPDLFFVDGAFADTTSGPRPGHVTWQQGAQFAARCGARRTVLLHFSHHVDFARLRQQTNERLVEARDGLRFSL